MGRQCERIKKTIAVKADSTRFLIIVFFNKKYIFFFKKKKEQEI